MNKYYLMVNVLDQTQAVFLRKSIKIKDTFDVMTQVYSSIFNLKYLHEDYKLKNIPRNKLAGRIIPITPLIEKLYGFNKNNYEK